MMAYDVTYGNRWMLHPVLQTDVKTGRTIVEYTYQEEKLGRGVDFLVMGFRGEGIVYTLQRNEY
jgi:hypothetical protein